METSTPIAISQEQALQVARAAFGDTAKVRMIEKTSDLSTKFRIAYTPDTGGHSAAAATPIVVGYGASWEEALQTAFISERGQARIHDVASWHDFRYQVSEDQSTLARVIVGVHGPDDEGHIVCDMEADSTTRFVFEYGTAAPSSIASHANAEQGDDLVVPSESFVIPMSISKPTSTPEKKVNATVEAPSMQNIAAARAAASQSPTQIPRAYVNPTNIRTGLLGWDDEVTPAAVLAAVTGEHLLIVGPPGNAKSLFARRLFANFEGGLFETQLSKYSDETALFGAPNLKKLREEGIFEYPKHGIAKAEWGFLDELFDASDVLLRTLLGILQEKKFTKGGHEEDIPLQSVIATANYTRVNDITAAVVDRFAISVNSPVLSMAQREVLYSNKSFEDVPKIANTIGIDQLKVLRAKAKEVEIPAQIVKALVSWTTEMGFTPRRERKLASIIRASAALAGRRKADENDIMAARFCVPISNSGKVEDAAKSLQPLKDAILQALHEGEQLAALGKMAQPTAAKSNSPADIIAAIRATKAQIAELRAFKCVSEKVNKKREEAQLAHEQNHEALARLLDI